MAYLQDSERAARLAEIDRNGIRVLPLLRSRWLRRTAVKQVSGHLGQIDGHPAAVYVAGGRLWLAIDGQAWFLDEVEAAVRQSDGGWRGRIQTPAGAYDFTARRTSVDTDATPFSDPEDVSFGLWVARLLEDADRRDVLREVLVDASPDTVPAHATAEPAGASFTDALLPSRRPGLPGHESA